MSFKGHQRQAKYLRQCELQHQHNERVQAVSRYYDHWDTVTNRFKNWTEPKYYEAANKTLEKKKEKDIKTKQLVERQRKLRELFNVEEEIYRKAIDVKNRPISSKKKVRLEVLQKVNDQLKEDDAIRRKLDMEAKLYGKWRHGVDDDSLLFESKSDNETLAKINWIEKKIDDQMQREKDEEAAQDRNLRLQIEAAKTEKIRRDRQMIRQREMAELRAMQDKNLEELKVRTNEFDMLEEKEQLFKQEFMDLEKEIELLTSSTIAILEENQNRKTNEQQTYNLKNVKAILRKRNKQFGDQLKLMIDILQRLRWHANDKKEIEELISNYRREHEENTVDLSRLDAMYESEAKSCLDLLEENWQHHLITRYEEIKKVITEQLVNVEEMVKKNDQRQEEVMRLRTLHLTTIEETNKKLKELVLEETEDDDRKDSGQQFINAESAQTIKSNDSQQSLIKQTLSNASSGRQLSEKSLDNKSSGASLGQKLTNASQTRDFTSIKDSHIQEKYIDSPKNVDTTLNRQTSKLSKRQDNEMNQSSKQFVSFADEQSISRGESEQSIGNRSKQYFDQTASQIKPSELSKQQSNCLPIGQPSRKSIGNRAGPPATNLSAQTLDESSRQCIYQLPYQSIDKLATQTATENQLIGAHSRSIDKSINQNEKSFPQITNPPFDTTLNAAPASRSNSMNDRYVIPDNVPRSLRPSKTRLTAPYACASTIPSILPTRDIPDTLKLSGRRLFPQKASLMLESQMMDKCTTSPEKQISDSFRNLNLDVWRDGTNTKMNSQLLKTESQEALAYQTSKLAGAPSRFGRKRVAWT